MATHTAVRRSKHATLRQHCGHGAVQQQAEDRRGAQPRQHSCHLLSDGRTDGTALTVNGDDTDRLGPGERLEIDAANVDPRRCS